MNLKHFEDQAVTLDVGCAERSCACYSPQFGDTDGVRYYPENIVLQQQSEIKALKEENQRLKMVHNYKMAGFK